MTRSIPPVFLFAIVAVLFIGTGMSVSWNYTFSILNMALVSAIMALGVNMQWGYAGLFNIGVMGFVALGGLATVLVGMPPEMEAIRAGGGRMALALASGALTIALAIFAWRRLPKGRVRTLALLAILIGGFFLYRWLFDPATGAIEAVNPANAGYLGGLGLNMVLAWPAGGVLAAGAAWAIGKTALGLRSDYLAIATLGIAEIVLAVMKNEDWLARGVKNVIGLPRPAPYEVNLLSDPTFQNAVETLGANPNAAAAFSVKLFYTLLFTAVLAILLLMAQLALKSPWGRMMRAIRDNEVAAEAMGKDVTRRHLQVFILGSAVIGIAGAMMTTLDGQLIPTSYQPLRFTFLVWVMVIVGGSGNNFGAVLGDFIIWWLWNTVESFGKMLFDWIIYYLPEGSALAEHLNGSEAHMRLLTMGVILLLVLRFSPRGLIPEK